MYHFTIIKVRCYVVSKYQLILESLHVVTRFISARYLTYFLTYLNRSLS